MQAGLELVIRRVDQTQTRFDRAADRGHVLVEQIMGGADTGMVIETVSSEGKAGARVGMAAASHGSVLIVRVEIPDNGGRRGCDHRDENECAKSAGDLARTIG